jgi:D-tagatose-1,6-bisphosphate aldolase subunit GatZ/KbaZ
MLSFSDPQPLLDLVADQKQSLARGIYSICSANPYVLEAGMLQAAEDGEPLLIEATCNQVNQFGGYSGMLPAGFAAYVAGIAGRMGYSPAQIILGGDHLGPSPWQYEPARSAMLKACRLVHDYVAAGFTKIHLDASMRCADDDPHKPLHPRVSVQRAASLCQAAEQAHADLSYGAPPVFVIGTEVPVPGGVNAGETGLLVSDPVETRQVIEMFRTEFEQAGLQDAWQRVIALVVQPGVEFGHTAIHEYDPAQSRALSRMIDSIPAMVFEAHSTDYQSPEALRQLVVDHFAILKVGPGLTFAFREAVFALARMENEWLAGKTNATLSQLIDVVDTAMLRNPRHWEKYYLGTPPETALARKYSLSDRIRYYWPDPAVQQALDRLLYNLEQNPPPLSLISQYLPVQYRHIRQKRIPRQARSMIWDHIRETLRSYALACRVG